MVRKEGMIEVWQYRFGSCVVDFFFYPVDESATTNFENLGYAKYDHGGSS